MKITEIRDRKGGLYGVHLDNGKTIGLKVDVLPEFDGMLTFTAMFPTGWLMTGEAGGFYGGDAHVTIDPAIRVHTGPLDGVRDIADDIRVSGDYVAATVDAVTQVMRTLGESNSRHTE